MMPPINLLRLTLATAALAGLLVAASMAAGTRTAPALVSFSRLTNPAALTVRPFLLDSRTRADVPDPNVPPAATWWSHSPTGDYLVTLRVVNEVQVEATFHDHDQGTQTVVVLPGAVMTWGGASGVGTFHHDWHPTAPLFAYVHHPVGAHVLRTLSPDGLATLGALAPDQLIEAVRWSPDGAQIAVLRAPDLYTLPATGGAFVPLASAVPGVDDQGYTAALYGWGVGGAALWAQVQYTSAQTCVLRVPLGAGAPTRRYCQTVAQPWSLRAAAYHPPTAAFAFERINENTFQNQLSLLAGEAATPDVFRIDSFWNRFGFAFAPDGERALVTSLGRGGRERLYLLDPATGAVQWLTDGFDGRWVGARAGWRR